LAGFCVSGTDRTGSISEPIRRILPRGSSRNRRSLFRADPRPESFSAIPFARALLGEAQGTGMHLGNDMMHDQTDDALAARRKGLPPFLVPTVSEGRA